MRLHRPGGDGRRLERFERGGLVFDVRDEGPRAGRPVILLHGFPENSSCWDGIAPSLNEAGYRTLAPDQRGYSPGARPGGRRAYRLPKLVADVVALADSAGVRRVHLVGHDWGAAVAWATAAWHPHRLLSLSVLSVPHPRTFRRAMFTSRQGLASAYMAFFRLRGLSERVMLGGEGHRLIRALVRSGLSPEKAERFVRHLSEPGALTAALSWYRAIEPIRVGRVGRVRVPTLYVWGSNDRAVVRAGAERANRYVSGPYRFEVLEGASHWLPEEAGGAVVPLLLDHFRAFGEDPPP